MAKPDLFTPFALGELALPNRVVMAPMTRNRAGPGNVPGALAVQYYTQRASAGLIATEATQVSPQGVGYPGTPGIHSDAQVAGWRRVTDAVHRAGGRIFLQLWHVGRISHPSLQPDGALPVAPSAIAAEGEAFTASGPQPFVVPRALETEEIPEVVAQFADGARRARAAGFDGVEIHGANGYLIDQFLRDGTNRRSDRYGGNLLNRARFLLEVTEAVAGVWGPSGSACASRRAAISTACTTAIRGRPSATRPWRLALLAWRTCTSSSRSARCRRALRRSRPISRRRSVAR
jgi:N-ethylmaleimide reductase